MFTCKSGADSRSLRSHCHLQQQMLHLLLQPVALLQKVDHLVLHGGLTTTEPRHGPATTERTLETIAEALAGSSQHCMGLKPH